MWGFIGWSVIALALVVIGIVSWNSKKPAGFFAGVKAEVNDIKKYNHSVGLIWFLYAFVFELCGLPLLFIKQNSSLFIVMVLGVVFSSIGLGVAYTIITSKYQR